ncbi:MAG: PAS domain-containing protein, partial [Chloroflexi bacterium]|nr:PAS domain-containing protein [Chloroflexota bacterium]
MKPRLLASLHVRLILLVFLALLPALGLLLYQVREQRNDAREAAQTEALRLAQLVAITQQEEVHGSSQLLRILAQHPAISGERRSECDRVLADILPQNTVYSNFAVADVNGDATCSALPLSGPVTVADRTYFQGALSTRDFFVGEFQIGRVTGMATMSTAYPLIDSSGQAQGIVFAVFDLSRLGALAAQVEIPAGSTLTIIDRSGTVLVRQPDPEGLVGKAFPEAAVTRALFNGTGRQTYEGPGLDGRDRLYAWSPLVSGGGASGVVLVGIPTRVAFAGVNGVIYRSIIALAIALVTIVVISRLFGNLFIMRPARALVGTAKRLAAGDLQARSGISHREGEFGEMARAFDEMAGSLQKRSEALRESEEKYRTLAEAAHDIIFLINKEMRVEYVNDFGAKMRGLPRGEIVGKHLREVFPEEGVPSALMSSVQEVIQTERSLYRERAMTFHGHAAWLGTWLSPIRDASGQVRAVLGISRDITERKRAEAALRLRTEEIEVLFTIAGLLAQPKSFEEKAREGMEELLRVTKADRVALRINDEKARGLRLVAEVDAPGFARREAVTVVPYDHPGIAGAAFQSAQQYVANDYAATPYAFAPGVEEGVKSGLALPIKSGDQVRAILALFSREREHFTPERVALLSAVADELGVLLENARLYQEVRVALESGRRRLEAFEKVAARLALEEAPERSVQQLVDTARELLEARYAAFAVWEDGGGMRYWFVSGLSPEEQQAVGMPPAGKGVLGLVRESGAALRLADLRTHPAAVGVPPRHPSTESFLGVPVFFKRRSVGAFYLTNKANGAEFTQEDERLLHLFAVVAGVVLENRTLYSQVSRERSTLAAIQASMTDGLVVLDQRGRIAFHNPMAEQISGMLSKDAEGKRSEELFQLAGMEFEPTEGFKTLLDLINNPPESAQTVEVTVARPQRREFSVTVFPIPLESGERLLGLVIHEETEANDLDRRKEAFVSIASHEIRTPLSSI